MLAYYPDRSSPLRWGVTGRRYKSSARSGSADAALVVIYGYELELDRQIVRSSSMVTTVGGHWELRAVALLKAVWWGMRLASLLMHLFLF